MSYILASHLFAKYYTRLTEGSCYPYCLMLKHILNVDELFCRWVGRYGIQGRREGDQYDTVGDSTTTRHRHHLLKKALKSFQVSNDLFAKVIFTAENIQLSLQTLIKRKQFGRGNTQSLRSRIRRPPNRLNKLLISSC